MKQLSSHDFEEVYKELDIDVDKLGCIMLDVDGSGIPEYEKFKSEDYLHTSENPKRFWIKGFVAGKTPHVTLLYGLLKTGKEWQEQVDTVLRSWGIKYVTIKEVGVFNSNYPDEDYYCIIAHLDITETLLEGHRRLQFLPHIDTFASPYKAHITIAYVKKDEKIRDEVVAYYQKELAGKELKVTALNYGGDKGEKV